MSLGGAATALEAALADWFGVSATTSERVSSPGKRGVTATETAAFVPSFSASLRVSVCHAAPIELGFSPMAIERLPKGVPVQVRAPSLL